MAIKELGPEEVRTLTLEEKDRWWRAHVFKGDLPQLTIRAALTGMVLGGVLSLTNLYVGIRTGWTLGVGLTSVILSFAAFKLLAAARLGREMTVLENNAMQSIATAAGYMTLPLISSVAAYMMVTQRVVPPLQTGIWIVLAAGLGVLFAFPLKKRFINDEQLPFPEGYAAGVLLDNLHSEHGPAGLFKAKVLAAGGILSALIEFMRSERVMTAMRLKWLTLPEAWDDLLYRVVTPRLLGTPLRDLTIRLDTSIVMIGTGGLVGIRAASSLLLGALLGYVVLAPHLLARGVIAAANYRAIASWTLWGGAALMTTASLWTFLSRPGVIVQALTGMLRRRRAEDAADPIADIELPMKVSAIGIPIVGAALVLAARWIFGVHLALGLLAIPLVFIFTIIAVHTTGLTSITPGNAIDKLTQLAFSFVARGQTATNIMTAGIASDVALNASNLLSDIKPGYMLGAKPRQQAVGHLLGAIAGSLVAVPVFYALFHGNIALFTSEAMPMPKAMLIRSVAEVLTHGFATLHVTARVAMAIGAALGVLIGIADQLTRGRFPISGVALGLGIFLRFTDTFAIAIGAFIFWLAARRTRGVGSPTHRILVEEHETLCAGIIAGGSIAGIVLLLLETLILR
ncbi:MAG TPA: OPT/YSL family transporter [Polyangia bacterium]|jgi:putative OPT family oligopeptide transporter|nr:OPT/YSL family transporter [Polyangia bacterium]